MKEKKEGRCVIMAGGPISDYSFYKPQKADFVICADSGYRHADHMQITPHVLLGDFDSIKEIPEEIERITYPAEKDETDLQIAISHALRMGYREIYIIGAFGGRCDHFLGNIGLLYWAKQKGASVLMEDAATSVRLVSDSLTLPAKKNCYLSLIPFFGDANVSVSGVKYSLQNHKMQMGDTLGISNEFTDSIAEINVHRGLILVLECRMDRENE